MTSFAKTVNPTDPGGSFLIRQFRGKVGQFSIGVDTFTYTADALVLRRDYLEVVEVKTTEEIGKLVVKEPDNWKRNTDGSVDFIPGRRAFKELGIRFRVFEYSVKMRLLIENTRFLLWSRQWDDAEPISSANFDRAFEQSYCWTLADLKDFLELKDYAPLVRKIDSGEIFIDMTGSLISEPKGCLVARSLLCLNAGLSSLRDGAIFSDSTLAAVELSKFPSEAEAERALAKLEMVNSGEQGRSVNRWLKKISDGRKAGLSDFQSLISNYSNCGNRSQRLFVDVEKFLDTYLRMVHPGKRGISIYRSYIEYRADAKVAHPYYKPVTRPTFVKRLSKLPPELVAKARGGVRAANAVATPTDPEKRSVKAQCAWQVATVDHYNADIELIFFANQYEVFVVRPWITALVDVFSNEVLAVTVSLKPPSRTACAKVIRECVRHHGRLPREIIVDRGSDFRSVFFAALLAHYKITLSLRPSGNPRWGSEVERLFGEFRQLWLAQLPGNLADKREVRSADGSTNPKKFAIFQPFEFYRALLSFCDWRGARCRGNAVESTALRFSSSAKEMPFIPVKVEYDSAFLLATAVDVERYKIDFQKGLHVGNTWYWSPDLSMVRGRLARVDVRVDPENPHVVFAQLLDGWVPCYSSGINVFSAKDKITQKVEGLLMREAQSARDAVRMHADEQLVHKIREMRQMAEDALVVPVLEVEAPIERKADSVFARIKSTKVSSLQLENWGA
ncbi:MAG: DDE-type integrase/transposase/recombinase [Gammaproteobacteria bacterium]